MVLSLWDKIRGMYIPLSRLNFKNLKIIKIKTRVENIYSRIFITKP